MIAACCSAGNSTRRGLYFSTIAAAPTQQVGLHPEVIVVIVPSEYGNVWPGRMHLCIFVFSAGSTKEGVGLWVVTLFAMYELQQDAAGYAQGHLCLQGKIKSLEQIYLFSMPVKEYQIVENFLGSALKDEVMKIMPVQKQTRAGQRTRFKAFVVVGDQNGHVGLGVKCAKEVSTERIKVCDGIDCFHIFSCTVFLISSVAMFSSNFLSPVRCAVHLCVSAHSCAVGPAQLCC